MSVPGLVVLNQGTMLGDRVEGNIALDLELTITLGQEIITDLGLAQKATTEAPMAEGTHTKEAIQETTEIETTGTAAVIAMGPQVEHPMKGMLHFLRGIAPSML